MTGRACRGDLRSSQRAAIVGILALALTACTGGSEARVEPDPITDNAVQNHGPTNVEILHLDRVPWEGGPEYWKQFSRAHAAGWSRDDFFPIVAWFDSVSTDEEAAYDKSLGINTYIGMPETTPYSLFSENDLYYIGPRLNDTYTDSSSNWVGQLLGDELDGQFPKPADGQRYMRERARTVPGGFFKYANFTQIVIGQDISDSDAETYVNDFTDVASMDMYWYSVPYCSIQPYRDNYVVPIEQEFCRTASSYGKAVRAMKIRDAADGRLQPIWQFVENYNGGPSGEPMTAPISPDQLEGAVMSSLINEARGIVYFNQSLSGDCQSGNVFRDSQVNAASCMTETVGAARRVNGKIHDLARVLNTQSYAYDFGTGLQTMLKVLDGNAYIFAMIDGSSSPGKRQFHLPDGITGQDIEVLYEDRSMKSHDGAFSDDFRNEATYHIYKVEL